MIGSVFKCMMHCRSVCHAERVYPEPGEGKHLILRLIRFLTSFGMTNNPSIIQLETEPNDYALP